MEELMSHVKSGELICDVMKKDERFKAAKGVNGKRVMCRPTDQHIKLNPTTNMGGCSGIYYSMTFQLPKWGYETAKLDEWMDVSPVHSDSYNLMISQRNKLEQNIKGGLQSAAQSVADYELLSHDLRKYREILDYFKMGQKDEHVLRSLFVDKVDAHTGEGYSLITMARRWPTIITDFIRMQSGWIDAKKIPVPGDQLKKIMEELKVSQAEATVLKTKSELFEEWKRLFFPEIKERYARTKTLVESRKKSVDEYREWLKPYIARHKMMTEATQKDPAKYASNIYMVPGFGQAVAHSGVRLWAWEDFSPQEMHRPETVQMVEPYDATVIEWKMKIEKKYKMTFKQKDIDTLKKKLKPGVLYYHMFDIFCNRTIIRLPQLGEQEDMDIQIEHFLLSQNIMLVHLMEVMAIEKSFERYVNEIIGTKESEEKHLRDIEKEFEPEKKEKKESFARKFRKRMKMLSSEEKKAEAQNAEAMKEAEAQKVEDVMKAQDEKILKMSNSLWNRISPYIVKSGPYEWQLKPRVTKMFLIPMATHYGGLVELLKFKMGVPGSKKTW